MLLDDLDICVDGIYCNDINCKDGLHHVQLQDIHDNIVSDCVNAGVESLPLHGCNKSS